VGGIVLSGGKSRRMGVDKALLPYNGITLLEHVLGIVRAAAGETIVVADVADKYVLKAGTRVVGDLYPDTGPLGGIITGLTYAADEFNLVVACDMPFLQPALLKRLIEAVEGYDAAVPEINGRLEPLCAAYNKRATEKLWVMLESGELAVHKAVCTLNIVRIGEEELRCFDPELVSFSNWNTPDDAGIYKPGS
jgi:molybdopterin-guanine dinucleotide biosynthesis protein A